MSQGADARTGVVYESILFREQYIEVSYTEERERGDENLLVRTRVVNGKRLIPEAYLNLIEALGEFVDAAEVQQRLVGNAGRNG